MQTPTLGCGDYIEWAGSFWHLTFPLEARNEWALYTAQAAECSKNGAKLSGNSSQRYVRKKFIESPGSL
jgi:hypothetical protein